MEMTPRKKKVLIILSAIVLYLAAESFLPPRWQPTAKASLLFIDAYQAVASPVARGVGFRCRYTPSCSQYAEDAIAHYGTLGGVARATGRLLRCTPWGGAGYDPVEVAGKP